MDAGVSGVHGHVVKKHVVEVFLHEIVLDIATIQFQCLVVDFVMERTLILKLLDVMIV